MSTFILAHDESLTLTFDDPYKLPTDANFSVNNIMLFKWHPHHEGTVVHILPNNPNNEDQFFRIQETGFFMGVKQILERVGASSLIRQQDWTNKRTNALSAIKLWDMDGNNQVVPNEWILTPQAYGDKEQLDHWKVILEGLTINKHIDSFFVQTPQPAILTKPVPPFAEAMPAEVEILQFEPIAQLIDKRTPLVMRAFTPHEKFAYIVQFKAFMLYSDLTERIINRTTRLGDFGADGKADPAFRIWNAGGKPLPVQRGMFVSYGTMRRHGDTRTDDQIKDATAAAQLKLWLKWASTKPAKAGFNAFTARMGLKPTRATAANYHITVAPIARPALGFDEDKLTEILQCDAAYAILEPLYPRANVHIVSHTVAEGDGNLRLVGISPMSLFAVYMNPAQYSALWLEARGIQNRLTIDFPAGDAIPQDFVNVSATLANALRGATALDGTEIPITSDKIRLTVGQRKTQGTGQHLIMGSSATPIAATLWPNVHPRPKVEWLHRSAFSFGGTKARVNHPSSNNSGNLVFGSKSSNTDMIRSENMIMQLTRQFKPTPRSQAKLYSGTLKTTTLHRGTVYRWELGNQARVAKAIPAWVNNARYKWLSFWLEYEYTMTALTSSIGETINMKSEFDPWSSYEPLLAEALIDDIIIKHLQVEFDPDRATAEAEDEEVEDSGSEEDNPLVANNPIVPQLQADGITNLGTKQYPPVGLVANSLQLQSNFLLMPTSFAYPYIAEQKAPELAPLTEDLIQDLFVETITDSFQDATEKIAQNSDVAPKDTSSDPSMEDWTIQKELNLFKTGIIAKLQRYSSVSLLGSQIVERVVIEEDFNLAMLLPLLTGTPFEKIIFGNVSFLYQNYLFDSTKTLGLNLNVDWIITREACSPLYDFLNGAMGVENPKLRLHAGLGSSQTMSKPFQVHSFILEGVFPGLNYSPVDGLKLTSVGLRLMGLRRPVAKPKPSSEFGFVYGLFGTMEIDAVKDSVLHYDIAFSESNVQLAAHLQGKVWENALGIDGLLLDDVGFEMRLATSAPWKSFAFDVYATFTFKESHIGLAGSYLSGGSFSVQAQMEHFTVEDIRDIYNAIFHETFDIPDYQILIGSATICIDSQTGLFLSLENVKIADHSALNAEVRFSKDGVKLSGALQSTAVSFGDVSLREAKLKVEFGRKGVDLMVAGTIQIESLAGMTVGAAVHLYPGAKGVEWALLAELDSPTQGFSMAQVAAPLKDTFLDFKMRKALFIAASIDDPSLSATQSIYKVKKGVQLRALIEEIPPLNDLLHRKLNNLVFEAAWSPDTGFELKVALPSNTSIDLGNGLRTKPISLRLRSSPVELAVEAGLIVPMEGSEPLDFTFSLGSSLTGAKATGEMNGWWVNPLGLKNVRVGPLLALGVEIDYAVFAVSGTPTTIQFASGLAIGAATASVVLGLSQDPKNLLLAGTLNDLSVNDLIVFANQLLEQDIPQPSSNVLTFHTLKLYVCTATLSMGSKTYAAGFSFDADLVVLEKRAYISCSINKSEKRIQVKGGIDEFTLGPLSVSGVKEPRAELDCSLGLSEQKLSVDGVVSIFSAKAQVTAEFQLMPSPKFQFGLLVQFADVFIFELEAKLIGNVGSNVSDADFDFHAEMQSSIIQFLTERIIQLLEVARTTVRHGIETAQKGLDDAKARWQADIDREKQNLEDALRNGSFWERVVLRAKIAILQVVPALLSFASGVMEAAKVLSELAFEGMERLLNFASRLLDIRSIIVDGTLRGVLGIGGPGSRPLSASISGVLLGFDFNINISFDPSNVVEFIKAIFEQLWYDIKHNTIGTSKGISDSHTQAISMRTAAVPPATELVIRPFVPFEDREEVYTYKEAKIMFIDGVYIPAPAPVPDDGDETEGGEPPGEDNSDGGLARRGLLRLPPGPLYMFGA